MSLIPLGFWAASGGGGAAGAYDLLESTILTSSASSVTFSGLGAYSDYKHLQIRGVARNESSTGGLNLRFNNDTGSNYPFHRLYGYGGSVTSGFGGAGSGVDMIAFASTNASATNEFGAGVIDILDFASTDKYKTARVLSGREQTGTSDFITLTSGVWLSTSAITEVNLYLNAGSLQIGSRFSLYGIKG